MEKKQGFLPYDVFKLIVAILLVLAIIILWITLPKTDPMSNAPAAETTEEVVSVEEEATEADEAAEEAAADANAEADTEADTETNAEMELPPLPEPNAGLEYDAAKGGLVNADGELVYAMNEDGTGWTPVIPDEMADMQLEGEWTLLDADGNSAYVWDAESQSWVAVEQEEVPAEEEQTSATTNVVDCPGSAEPRLEGGKNAEVLRDVNFRSSPGVGGNWIGGFAAGDQVSVVGETSCTPHGNGAYLWWQVERADGTSGWIAEAAANSPKYFLGPVE